MHNNIQTVNSVNDIEFVQGNGANYSSQFAIVKDSKGDRLYAWGNNGSGQLGLGDINNRSVPTLVTDISGRGTISYVTRSYNYTLVIINKREFWAAGKNEYGQFWNKTTNSSAQPKFTKTNTFPADVTSFSAGYSHAVAIFNNKLYTWGNNQFGQLGIDSDDKNNILEPKEVTALSDKTLGQVKCGESFTIINARSVAGTNNLYLWGENNNGQLGDGTLNNSKKPKLLNLSGEIIDYYASGSAVFVVMKDGIFSKLYSWGFGADYALGTGLTQNEKSPVLIKFPEPALVTNIYFGGNSATFALTESKKVYSCGSRSHTGQGGANVPLFKSLPILDGLTQFVGGYNLIAVKDDKIYAFGTPGTGGYGDGTTSPEWNIPTQVDPFSIPSSLTQKNFGKDQLATNVAAEIYPSGIFNSTNFNKYVSHNFPSGTSFSATTAPVVDAYKGTIELSVTINKYYSLPDGAKTFATKQYEITLTGFKEFHPASKITNLPLASDTKFNLNNIVSAMKQPDTNKVNMANFNQLFTASDFVEGNEFTISDDKVINNKYSAIIYASSSYDDDSNHMTNQAFNITISGLKEQPDSVIKVKPDIDPIFNLTNIVKLINPANDGKVNRTNLDLLCEIANFPAGFTLSVKDDLTSGDTYTATLVANNYYFGGNLGVNGEFKITVPGLIEQPDSTIKVKTIINPVFNLTNIVKLINPASDGSVDQTNLDLLCDITNFPAGSTFNVKDDLISGDTYSATLVTNHYYLDGNIVANGEFKITVTGLIEQPDSAIKVKTIINPIFNLTNIVKLVNPANDGKVDQTNLDLLCDITNFPAGSIYSVKDDLISGDTYSATLVTNHYYLDGNIVANGEFKITVPGLVARPDSTIKVKTIINPVFNLTNIVKLVNPANDGKVDQTNLDLLCDITNFPAGSIYSVKDDLISGDTYSATLVANHYYLDGNIVANGEFKITVPGLVARPDSTIKVKTIINPVFNLTNIVKLINPASDGSVDQTNLDLLCDITNFPAGSIYSVKDDLISGDTYNATLVANNYYFGGNLGVNGEFKITVPGLVARPDSTIKVKTIINPVFNLTNIVKLINPASDGSVDQTNLDLLCDITNFPAGSIYSVKDDLISGDTYNATLVANNYYFGGNLGVNGEFKITVPGLIEQPDSTIKVKTIINPIFNLTSIVKLINPANDGKVNRTNLDLLCDITNFPAGSIFSVKDDLISGDTYSATLVANHYYLDGNIVANGEFKIVMPGLIEQPDSTIKVKTIINPIFNLTSIVKLINPANDGKVNRTNLDLLCDITNFPAGSIYSVKDDLISGDTYSATLVANHYYLDGNMMANGEFKIVIPGLAARPDSTIKVKTIINPVFNLTNIVKLISPANNTQVDPEKLELLCDINNFPNGYDSFTIATNRVTNGIYNLTLIANNYYLGGNIRANGEFKIQVGGLIERPDSRIVEKPVSTEKIKRILESLKPANRIKREELANLIDVSYFPVDAKFTIVSIDISIPKFTFISDKIYHEGSIVPSDEINNSFAVDYTPTPVNQTDIGLIIGLSIGAVLLLLIISGLIIRYFKHKNKTNNQKW